MEVAISIADSIENAGVKATPLETKGFILYYSFLAIF